MPLFPLGGSFERLLDSPAVATLLATAVVVTSFQLAMPRLRVRSRLGLSEHVNARHSWRLVTWLFPQEWGLLHLVGNGGALYLYGPYLEQTLGTYGFAMLYLLAGVFGGAWSVAVAPAGLEGNAGASQATFGIFGGLFGAGLAASLIGDGTDPLTRSTAVLALAVVVMLPLSLVAALATGQRPSIRFAAYGLLGHSPGAILGVTLGFALVRWPSVWSTTGAGAIVVLVSLVMLEAKWAPWALFASKEVSTFTPWLERRASS